MPIKDLLVGRFSNGVVTLINDQKVDSRQVEEIVIEGIQKHLVNHDQNLQRKNKTLLIKGIEIGKKYCSLIRAEAFSIR